MTSSTCSCAKSTGFPACCIAARSAGFPACCIADFLVGSLAAVAKRLLLSTTSRLENLRYGRLESLRYGRIRIREVGLTGLVVLLLTFATSAKAEGIPEPSLVIYGAVNNPSGNRVSFGTLNWVFRPADGGSPITLTGILTNINDQFSYVLRVPCETEIPGFPVSDGALKLAASSTRYDRSQVTVQGVAASFREPALATLVLSRTDRGRIERIDLTVNLGAGSGLPEAWQMQYFGRTGINPNDDADRDGLNNLAEFKAGTNPTDPQSLFEIIAVQVTQPGQVLIEWSVAEGKFYTLQRSGDLFTGFSDLRTRIPATAPQNSFRDTSATGTGPYFYRLRVEE